MYIGFPEEFTTGHFFSPAPLAPNATLQAPPIAAVRHERRLLAVACKRLLGWGCPPPAAARPHCMPPDVRSTTL